MIWFASIMHSSSPPPTAGADVADLHGRLPVRRLSGELSALQSADFMCRRGVCDGVKGNGLSLLSRCSQYMPAIAVCLSISVFHPIEYPAHHACLLSSVRCTWSHSPVIQQRLKYRLRCTLVPSSLLREIELARQTCQFQFLLRQFQILGRHLPVYGQLCSRVVMARKH